jgi:hypothetical protein
VEIKGQLTEVYGIERGKGQGDALSKNTVLEKTIRNIQTNPNKTIFNRTLQYIAFADDVLILSVCLEEVLTQIKEDAVNTALMINKSKAKHMKINRNVRNLEQDLIMNGHVFEMVQNFRYLGALMN